jgi:hypothetical protein
MMLHYPSRWQPTSNGITMQRARMLLPLAWLVRVNDTAQHRAWLSTVADGLLARQRPCGAIQEEVSAAGWGGTTRVPNNQDYGTFEAPLNQANTDPVSDLLYTSNFALLGLHEAAAATQNVTLRAAEDRLAQFLVRIQAKSDVDQHPEMAGAYMRGFDFDRWEVWASDADVGWGAWSVETGWTQSWISIVLGLRQLNTTLWEASQPAAAAVGDEIRSMAPLFFYTPPPPPPVCLNISGMSPSNILTVVNTTDASLCAPAPQSTVSHVQYHGHVCGPKKDQLEWLGKGGR